ncbi:MAG: hypothetical protein N2445_02050 [Acidobacteria bacterium]|nr:hypothetical protein [Acidobacteriota bacterium]
MKKWLLVVLILASFCFDIYAQNQKKNDFLPISEWYALNPSPVPKFAMEKRMRQSGKNGFSAEKKLILRIYGLMEKRKTLR